VSFGELVLVIAIAALAIGPARLPAAGKLVGKGLRNVRRGVREAQDALDGDVLRETTAFRPPQPPRLID